jgi:hypothetical protein
LNLHEDDEYGTFREALRELMHGGRVVLGARGVVMLPRRRKRRRATSSPAVTAQQAGVRLRRPHRFHRPRRPVHPRGQQRRRDDRRHRPRQDHQQGHKDGKAIYSGRVTEILQRTLKRFVGSLVQSSTAEWTVCPTATP